VDLRRGRVMPGWMATGHQTDATINGSLDAGIVRLTKARIGSMRTTIITSKVGNYTRVIGITTTTTMIVDETITIARIAAAKLTGPAC
jgi:hypothetical protein